MPSTLHTPENGRGFKPVTVATLRAHIEEADGHVEIEVRLPDGSLQKVYGAELNPRTRDSFRLLCNSSESDRRRAPMRAS